MLMQHLRAILLGPVTTSRFAGTASVTTITPLGPDVVSGARLMDLVEHGRAGRQRRGVSAEEPRCTRPKARSGSGV